MKNTYTIFSLEELSDLAKDFVKTLSTLSEDKAVVVALSGDLGAGKTTFVQQLAHFLGITEVVTSPTFTIMKGYDISRNSRFSKLVHMDAYRIEEINEVEPLRLNELMENKNTLICIEWAEKISQVLPANTHYLNIANGIGEVREITYKQGL